MVGSAENRTTFIHSALPFLRLHEFDGLDIDWQFPGENGSRPEDKLRFTVFVKVSRPECLNQACSFIINYDFGSDYVPVLRN